MPSTTKPIPRCRLSCRCPGLSFGANTRSMPNCSMPCCWGAHSSPRNPAGCRKNAGLIIRVRQSWNWANRIFLQLPDEVQLSSRPEGKFCPMNGRESSPCMGQNLPTSKKEKKKTDSSQNNRRENARRCFGRYQNVFLLDSELADLQSTYPGQYEDYINRLSAYMASSGKHYANHYATIRKWLDEDSKSKPGKNYDYTETYEEGECL